MDWIQALILGIVQGLTEFLPVSSSGHLVLAQHLLSVDEPGVLLEVILHMGTLAAILFYFYDDLKQLVGDFFKGDKEAKNYVLFLIIATIPAVCAGLALKDSIESTFTVSIVKWMLMITGLVVGGTYFFKNRPNREMVLMIALCIGFVQTLALLPGISRSGITISVALIMGIQHQKAAKFAFFMAIPVLMGAGLLEVITIGPQVNISTSPLIVGFISSAVTGYLVISWLLDVISRGKFYMFSLYCFVVSFLAFTFIS
ncbi:MAG: undecaprenyl-diphosphate phosphatase [Candidatus Marinimicrobia bacterium]|nr:undecaprenyl-diphosphate phosphatase [Candidatus Neomarinimicrobiota bacterium]